MNLPNGSTAYHLHVLIKDEKIVSKMEGAKRRFYPKGRSPPILPGSRGPLPKGLQIEILSSLEEYPGQSQKDIAKKLHQSQQTISYQLNQLMKMGYIDIVKGKVNRYIIHGGPTAFSCPECHTQFTSDTPPKFCPGCGLDLNKLEEN